MDDFLAQIFSDIQEEIDPAEDSAFPSKYRISGRPPTPEEEMLMQQRADRRDWASENNYDDFGPMYDTSVVGDDNVPDWMGQMIEEMASQIVNQDPAYQAYKQRVLQRAMRPPNVEGGSDMQGPWGRPMYGDDEVDDPRDYTPTPTQMLRQLRGH